MGAADIIGPVIQRVILCVDITLISQLTIDIVA